jgi:hypothetical protein
MVHADVGILTKQMRILHALIVLKGGGIYQVQISNDFSGGLPCIFISNFSFV